VNLKTIEVAVRAKNDLYASIAHGAFGIPIGVIFKPGDYARTLQSIKREYGRTDEKFISEFKGK